MTLLTRRVCLAVALAIAAGAFGVSGAGGQVGRPADLTALKLSGPVAADLRSQGVKASAIAPADRRKRTISLPVLDGGLDPVVLRHEGGMRLRGPGGSASLRSFRINAPARGRSGKVSAILGGKRRTLFALRGRPAVDATTRSVTYSGASLVLTRSGAARLRSALGLDSLGAGTLGRVRSSLVLPAPQDPGPPFQPGELGPPPPVLTRPGTSVDVTDVEIAWHPRDSWLRYIAAGGPPPEGTTAFGGAAAGPVENASQCPDRPVGPTPLVYSYAFTPAASWYDAASGTAGIYGTGGTRFRRDEYALDISMSNPEVEINGDDSRLIFTFSGGGDSVIPTQRAVLADLVTDGTPTSTGPAPGGGTEYVHSLVRGDLAEAGSAAFGAYPAGDDWGCVSVAFTVAP